MQMAIAGRFDDTPGTGGMPRDNRRTLQLETQGALASGRSTNVVVHNVSATGMLVESDVALTPGEGIAVDLPQVGLTTARVVWSSGKLFGCQFEAPISSAALSAAQLRSAVTAPVELAMLQGSLPGESFALRLRRLRKERGLSLSRIATQLGVSKPTVWAWEQGKARPVEARIDALAEVLGVQRIELMAGAGRHDLDDMIARSRQQIAEAVGTRVENVRIMIEL
jgi:transcriptional regulator with XRE-family HTH domain